MRSDRARRSRAAAPIAGLDPRAAPVADLGVFCLSRAPTFRSTIAGIAAMAAPTRDGSATDVLRNDTFAVLRAGTDRAVGRRRRLRLRNELLGRVAGRSRDAVPGDRTGERRLGRRRASSARLPLWHAIRAEDGRGRTDRRSNARVPDALRHATSRPGHGGALLRNARGASARRAGARPVRARPRRRRPHRARRRAARRPTRSSRWRPRDPALGMQTLDVDVVLGGGIFQQRLAAVLWSVSTSGSERWRRTRACSCLNAPPVVGARPDRASIASAHEQAAYRRHVRASLTHERLAAKTAAAHTASRQDAPRARRREESDVEDRLDRITKSSATTWSPCDDVVARDRATASSWCSSVRPDAASPRSLRMIAGLEEVTAGEITIGDARGHRPRAEGAGHRDGVPELRPLPAHDRRSRTSRSG